MPTIGLCMIVKNEARVIERCLDSVRPFVDYVLAQDTGSTDGTQDIIRRWLDRENMPGAVIDEPWRDFAYNRTLALAQLREWQVDYALMMDADDVLVSAAPPAAFKASLTADFYDVHLKLGGVSFWRPQIFRNRIPFRYRGALHEFFDPPPGKWSRETAVGIHIAAGTDGHRSDDPDKYRNDAETLERLLETEHDPFLRARYTFYMAQSFRDCGEREDALTAYLERAGMGFWHEEVFYSLYSAAKLMEALGRPGLDVIAMYLRAHGEAPHRAEALHGAARVCRMAGQAFQGAMLARQGLDIPLPAGGLFVEPWVYEHGVRDEMAACERMLGKSPRKSPELSRRAAATIENCPVCRNSEQNAVRPGLPSHPYTECAHCGLYYQPAPPPKSYEASHEIRGDQMSEADRTANRMLAEALYRNHLVGAFVRNDLAHLDIGSKYPYFGHCLQIVGRDRGLRSYGIDGITEAREFGQELGVTMAVGDFEDAGSDLGMPDVMREVAVAGFHCVTMIHCLEHMYDPTAALRRVRSIMADGGVLFIRSPDSAAPDIERDFTPGHYEVHPTIWCQSAMLAALDRLGGVLELYETYVVGHCRDYLLRATAGTPVFNILRPGAIGDVIASSAVTTQLAARPGAVVNYYTKHHEAAALLSGVTHVHDADRWTQRPAGTDLHMVGYPLYDGYPERPMRKHLAAFFCDEAGLPAGHPKLRSGTLSPVETYLDRWITVHPTAGWSVYKEWPTENWREIVSRLQGACPGIGIVQIGEANDPDIGADCDMRERTSIPQAVWLISKSVFHLGGDSFSNHAAGALRHPAVILFGSTSPTGSGYASAVNLWAGLPCSPCYREDPALSRHDRGPCINPPGQVYAQPRHACMAELSVDRVWDAIADLHDALAHAAVADGIAA